VSAVGWNILGLQPIGILFSKKISALCYVYLTVYDILCCVFIYLEFNI
jgi:hypothetical protein